MQRENDLSGASPHRDFLPKRRRACAWPHIKQGEKNSFDWPLADVAVVLDLTRSVCRRAAIVLGAAAPVPHRARKAEAALTGKRIDESVAAQQRAAALDGATPLSKNAYKLPLFEALVRRAILKAVA